jgi:ABC-type antimicrobial peptide transport system permease subunit
MFQHYLKIAWRNLRKYKTQTVVSILGLAIGFTAFAFTLSWIRYEMSYDSFNPEANRIYRIEQESVYKMRVRYTSYGLSAYLRDNFPEVAAASNTYSGQVFLTKDAPRSTMDRFNQDCRFIVQTDTAFFSVFYPDMKVTFPYPLPEGAAIFSRSVADKLGITPRSFGQKLDSLDMTITPIAIVDDKPLPSNVAFGLMTITIPDERYGPDELWNHNSGFTYVRLHKGSTIERVEQALDSLRVITQSGEQFRSYKVYPLRKVQYLARKGQAMIKFEALKQFSVISLLVIIAALINYIMLFVSRVKARWREFALNKVNGASDKEILLLLLHEFMITLLVAIFVGGLLTEWLFPAFSRFSMIVAPKSYFLVSVFWYSLIIIVVSTLITFGLIRGFVRRSIRENITPETKSRRGFRVNFTHVAIFVQLAIGVLLIFCITVACTQYHLINQRVGYDRNGLMVFVTLQEKIPVSEFKKIPGVGSFIVNSESFFKYESNRVKRPVEVIGKDQHVETYELAIRSVSADFRDLLRIPLLEGRDMLPSEHSAYFINETGNRELGGNAVGKTIHGNLIIGIIPDLQVFSALEVIQPTLYRLSRYDNEQQVNDIMFRCENDSVKKRVDDWFSKMFLIKGIRSDNYEGYYSLDIDKGFKEHTTPERYLLMLIGIMTGVAILIAVFGIYSMITLACNQRRKEMAIRKVNGAKAKEILALFFRQYFAVTVAACAVAFPVGVHVMQRWLEQYTRRVSMEWWLFAGVFVLVVAIVFTSMAFRVCKAASENPAEVVKAE